MASTLLISMGCFIENINCNLGTYQTITRVVLVGNWMGQKHCKKYTLELPHKLHAEIKKQANVRNITMRTFILRYLMPHVIKNNELYK